MDIRNFFFNKKSTSASVGTGGGGNEANKPLKTATAENSSLGGKGAIDLTQSSQPQSSNGKSISASNKPVVLVNVVNHDNLIFIFVYIVTCDRRKRQGRKLR